MRLMIQESSTLSTNNNLFFCLLLNELRFVCRGLASNIAFVKLWKFVSNVRNRLSISMQASVTRDSHLVFLCILGSWCFTHFTTLSIYTSLLFSSLSYFCCLLLRNTQRTRWYLLSCNRTSLFTNIRETTSYRLKIYKQRHSLLNK